MSLVRKVRTPFPPRHDMEYHVPIVVVETHHFDILDQLGKAYNLPFYYGKYVISRFFYGIISSIWRAYVLEKRKKEFLEVW